jgi:hypothetical protein
MAIFAEHPIGLVSADERIIACARLQGISAIATLPRVFAIAARYPVIGAAALKAVGPTMAKNCVIAVVARQMIGAKATLKRVAALPTIDAPRGLA